jgi:hypothetical protein
LVRRSVIEESSDLRAIQGSEVAVWLGVQVRRRAEHGCLGLSMLHDCAVMCFKGWRVEWVENRR